MTVAKLSRAFEEALKQDKNYQKAFKLVRKSSKGNIWIIGGTVFRNLAHILYNTPLSQNDYDFIVEETLPLKNLKGWQITYTRFGNPRLKSGDLSIDLVALKNVDYIKRKKLTPVISNFLLGNPLTIQSIAFDTTNGQIIGQVGLEALQYKTVGIFNMESAELYCDQLGISVNEYIKSHAKSLRFTPILPK